MKICNIASRERRKPDHAARVLTGFFLLVIALGSLLLSLPISSRSGESCGGMTAVFTATSATCVTGLSLVDTYTQWSAFGQVVLLGLIQIGGLGYMAFVSVFYFLLRRRIGLRERLVIQQAMALDELEGVVRLVRLMLAGTFLVEGTGALILTLRFAAEYPLKKALWLGIFHSISAFCNAGFDIMGFLTPGASLASLKGDVVINLTLSALITIGGLGFFVWNDLLMLRRKNHRLSVHTRLVLWTTGILLIGGTLAILVLEWKNPETLGKLPVGQKILAAFFQSGTTRTAGFAAIDQGSLTGSGKLVSMLLMLVGGSSGSTAGGIKTVSVALLFIMSYSVLRNHRETGAVRSADSAAADGQRRQHCAAGDRIEPAECGDFGCHQRTPAGGLPVRIHFGHLHRGLVHRHHRRTECWLKASFDCLYVLWTGGNHDHQLCVYDKNPAG